MNELKVVRKWVGLGALLAGIGVALGAFGAHTLSSRPGFRPDLWQTATHYHIIHAIAVIALAAACGVTKETRTLRIACNLMTAGIILFSGSLCLLAVTGIRWLGAITPLGGVCFLLGWGVVGVRFLGSGSEGAKGT